MRKTAFAFTSLILLASCGSNGSGGPKVASETDTVISAQAATSSASPTAKRDPSKAAELRKFFKVKGDEFSKTKWVEPKDGPPFRNRNALYCYFSMEDSTASNFRFVIQYYADDWLFFTTAKFNIDGQPFGDYSPSKSPERDNGDGMIWEWSDNAVDITDLRLIEALAGAKSAKVRLEGRQYYKDKTITEAQLQSIRRTLEYYRAMGGTFE